MTQKQDAERPARCERPFRRNLEALTALSVAFSTRSECLADVCLLACDAFVLFHCRLTPHLRQLEVGP